MTTTMAPPKTEPLVAFSPVTRHSIKREYFRLMDLVRDAEEERAYKWTDENGEEQVESFSLLDAEHGQKLREEYHERAEVVLRAFDADEQKGRPLVRL